MIIKVPTSQYIKEWCHCNDNDKIASSLLSAVAQARLSSLQSIYTAEWPTSVTLDIGSALPKKLNGQLHRSHTQAFNRSIALIIRSQLINYISTYLDFDSSLTRAVDYAREKAGLSFESYSDDTIIKNYQRWRAKHNGKFLYNKNINYAS